MINLKNVHKKRIDELGRIVIPKDFRKIYNINNWDELSILCEDSGILIKKVYSIERYKKFFELFLLTISKYLKFDISLIKDQISFGTKDINYCLKSDFLNKKSISDNKEIVGTFNEENILSYVRVEPIIIDSNWIVSFVFLSDSIFNSDDLDQMNIIINMVNEFFNLA